MAKLEVRLMLFVSALVLGGSVPSRCPGEVPSRVLIVVVRADGVGRSELGGDPERTPQLRELAETGISLPLLELSGGARTGTEVVDGLFTASLLRQLEKHRIVHVKLTVRGEAVVRDGAVFRDGDGRTAVTKPRSALEELKERFGDPGPVSAAEKELLASVQRVLAVPFEGAPPSGSEAPPPPRPIPAQIRRVLESGVALVIVDQPGGEASERDGLIGNLRSIAESLRASADDEAGNKPRVTLAVLSIRAQDGVGSLILAGPTLRQGWVLARQVPFPAIGPTLLYILDPKLISAKLEKEILHDIFR